MESAEGRDISPSIDRPHPADRLASGVGRRFPDGKAYNLDDTIQRVRYREGYDIEVFMGGNNYDEAVGVVAHNIVHHSAACPSQIRVSVVKR